MKPPSARKTIWRLRTTVVMATQYVVMSHLDLPAARIPTMIVMSHFILQLTGVALETDLCWPTNSLTNQPRVSTISDKLSGITVIIAETIFGLPFITVFLHWRIINLYCVFTVRRRNRFCCLFGFFLRGGTNYPPSCARKFSAKYKHDTEDIQLSKKIQLSQQ
jgi:hypothetical protein